MHIVVRADGCPEIGYGHLVRTGALAAELLDRNHDVTYATTTPEHVREVCPNDVEIVILPSRDDPAPAREFVREHADVTVLDSYLADSEYQQELRMVAPLVVIADDTRHQVAADVLVNGNLYAPELTYETIGEEPKRCLGPEYVLLRPEIAAYTSKNPPWRETPSRAIVTMGGSDVANLTPTVIRAFDGFDLRVDAIVGPGFSDKQADLINQAAGEVSADVCIVRDPDNLPERMFQADLGITTASTTTYELLALGTPIVSIPVVDNQNKIAQALREMGLATVLNRGAEKEAFRVAIESYLVDDEFRNERRHLGRSLVDGQGTVRVTNVVHTLSCG